MKTVTILAVLAVLAGAAVPATAQQTNAMPDVIAPGAQVQKLAGGFKFTEGPTCDAQGNVFFTDQPNNRILKWSVDGGLSTFKQPAGRANGMCFDAAGNLDGLRRRKERTLVDRPRRQAVTVIARGIRRQTVNGPNDVWVRPDGGLYFTDPFYTRSWWTHTERPQDGEHVYFLSADRKTPEARGDRST